MTEFAHGHRWQPQATASGAPRGLRDDPGRILLLIAAALCLSGHSCRGPRVSTPLGHPVAYTAQMGLADGLHPARLALILAVMAGTRMLVETTSRTMQLLPLALAVVAVAMWIGADRDFAASTSTSGPSWAATVLRR